MERNFNYKAVDMLIGSRVVCENFKTYKTELTAVNSTWADPFIDDLETRVNTAINKHLGIDTKSLQKLATGDIQNLQKEAGDKLALFKTVISVNFDDNKDRLQWILDTLGFTRHLKNTQNNDQEALIQLIAQFTENMTPELKTEITDTGMAENLITGITDMAENVRDADVTQEKQKVESKTHTEEAIKEFNEIFTIIIGICKIGHKIFKSDKLKAEHFSFAHIVGAMNFAKKKEEEEENEE